MPKKSASEQEIVDWVEVKLLASLESIKKDLTVSISTVNEDDPGITKTARSLEFVENKISSISRVLEIIDEGGEISIDNSDDYNVNIKPLYVKNYSHKLMFDLADQIILMSATILDPNQFCNDLGIDKNDVYYLEITLCLSS